MFHATARTWAVFLWKKRGTFAVFWGGRSSGFRSGTEKSLSRTRQLLNAEKVPRLNLKNLL
jgi:hypothetical protein